MASRNFFIKILNEGFIVTEGGKDRAVEYQKTVDEILKNVIVDMTKKLSNVNTNNMSITITVEENCPTVVDR